MSDAARKAWALATLKELKPLKTQKGLAAALGVTPPNVSRRLNSDQPLKMEEWQIIITYLGRRPPAEIDVAVRGKEVQPMPIIGQIKAGAWRETQIMAAEPLRFIEAVEDDRYLGLKHFSMEVLDESAEKIGAYGGSFLICVPYKEACPNGPPDGKWVIGRHILRSHGGKREKILFRESVYIVETYEKNHTKNVILRCAAKDAGPNDDHHYRGCTANFQITSLIVSLQRSAP